MSITTTEEVVVDLTMNNEFTKAHLKITREIYDNHWKKFYPELYGDKLPDAIEFEKFDILPAASVTGNQSHRVGGKSVRTKLLEIKQNIERNGFKLKYPPISWFRWHDGVDGIECITSEKMRKTIEYAAVPTYLMKKIESDAEDYAEENGLESFMTFLKS